MKFTAELVETPEREHQGISHKIVVELSSSENPEKISGELLIARSVMRMENRLNMFRDGTSELLFRCSLKAKQEMEARIRPQKSHAEMWMEISQKLEEKK